MSLRVVVVGFGFMGQTHAGNILKNPKAELVGIVDPFDPAERLASIKGNTDSVHITAADVKNVPHYLDMDSAFQNAKADACIIALPTRLHVTGVMKALEYKLHVMVEKPFALDLKDCENMIQTAEKAGKILAVGQSARCNADNQFIRQCIRDQRYGKVKCMDFYRICGRPDWGSWPDPAFFKASGGALFDMVSHDIDIARYCLGSEPCQITVDPLLSQDFEGNYITSVLDFNGTHVQIRGGFVSPSRFPFKRHFTVFFEKATLFREDDRVCQVADAEGIHEQTLEAVDSHREETIRFVDACLGEGEVYCTGADAINTIRTCWMIKNKMNAKEN